MKPSVGWQGDGPRPGNYWWQGAEVPVQGGGHHQHFRPEQPVRRVQEGQAVRGRDQADGGGREGGQGVEKETVKERHTQKLGDHDFGADHFPYVNLPVVKYHAECSVLARSETLVRYFVVVKHAACAKERTVN